MKKLMFLFVLVGISTSVRSQIEPELLVNITAATTLEIQNATAVSAGSLVYNSDDGSLYLSDGLEWMKFNLEGKATIETKTTNYQLNATDAGKVLLFNSTTDMNLTVPDGLPIGFNISVYQIGDGQVILNGAPGVLVKNRLSRFKTAGLDAGAGLICTGTNIFHLTGDLKK